MHMNTVRFEPFEQECGSGEKVRKGCTHFYGPPTELREGNVLSRVSHVLSVQIPAPRHV